MRVLLTGAAGFIGSHLLERLQKRGDAVVGVDDFNDYYDPALKERNVRDSGAREIHRIDFTAMEPLLAAKLDVVVHLAARAGVRPSIEQPELYTRVNVGGTVALVEMMRRAGVRRLVWASSSSVYGDAPVPFREDEARLAPLSPYGASKLAGEHFLRVFQRLHGFQMTLLRFFTVFGPRQRPDMMMHKFARLMLAGKPLPLFGEGGTERDYTYVDDIIDGVVAAIDRAEDFEVYNLGGSKTTPLRDVVEILEKQLGVKAKIDRQAEHPADPKRTFADISKARSRLGFDPKVGVDEGLQRFVAWLRRA